MNYLDNLFNLKDKTVVITGAANGISKAIAESFIKCGSKVISVDKVEQKSKDYTSSVTVDLSKKEEVLSFLKSIGEIKVDILINGAGIALPSEEKPYPIEYWKETYKVNLLAPFLLIRSISDSMIKNSIKGSIINITSINAELAFPDNPAYIATKGGLKSLTKSFAYDLGKYGIRVNSIGPGYIRTNMTTKSWADHHMHKQRKLHTILNRWGTVKDLVGASLFLASDASSYITGQDIYVDGGWTIKGL